MLTYANAVEPLLVKEVPSVVLLTTVVKVPPLSAAARIVAPLTMRIAMPYVSLFEAGGVPESL